MKRKVPDSPAAATLIDGPDITPSELQLAVRNHSMPIEALRYDITPIGLHYLLTHFDIPAVDPAEWALAIGGRVKRPLRLVLEEIKSRPSITLAVTLECAGNGRARLSPRPMSQPWLTEAVGTAEWTGTPLKSLLDEAQPMDAGGAVVFTGMDRGIQGDIEQQYERSLPFAEANRDEVLLAYAINGQPLPPQHGFPLRLIVPGWYGMAHVKWLRGITVVANGFGGYQQATAYHYRIADDDGGVPVTRILPRALMLPPGIPDWSSSYVLWSPNPTARCRAPPTNRSKFVTPVWIRLGGRCSRTRCGLAPRELFRVGAPFARRLRRSDHGSRPSQPPGVRVAAERPR